MSTDFGGEHLPATRAGAFEAWMIVPLRSIAEAVKDKFFSKREILFLHHQSRIC